MRTTFGVAATKISMLFVSMIRTTFIRNVAIKQLQLRSFDDAEKKAMYKSYCALL